MIFSTSFAAVNTPPSVHTLEPLSPEVTVEVGNSVKFVITTADHDNEDTLFIQWYVDGVKSSFSDEMFTFNAVQSDIGEHYIEVIVTDGKENVTRGWTVIVKEKTDSEDLLFGITWDQWSLIITVIGAIFLIIIVIIIVRVVNRVESEKRSKDDEMGSTKRK
jgi:hypothetical protein